MAGEVRVTLADGCDPLLLDNFEALGIEDPGGFKIRRGHGVTRVIVTVGARPLCGVVRV